MSRSSTGRQQIVDRATETYAVTLLLIAVLVLWFEIQLLVFHYVSPDLFRWLFAVKSVRSPSPGWLFSVLSHATWRHLAVNAAMLLVFGGLAEPHLGRREYVAFFFGIGTVAGLVGVSSTPGDVPLVGASSAVFGFVGYSLYHYARHHDRVSVSRRGHDGTVLGDERELLKLAMIGLGFPLILLQIGLTLTGIVPSGSTAIRAHAFGLLGGVLYEYWQPIVTSRTCTG